MVIQETHESSPPRVVGTIKDAVVLVADVVVGRARRVGEERTRRPAGVYLKRDAPRSGFKATTRAFNSRLNQSSNVGGSREQRPLRHVSATQTLLISLQTMLCKLNLRRKSALVGGL